MFSIFCGGPLAMWSVAILTVYLVLKWIYSSKRLDLKREDYYILITGCDTGFGNSAARRLDKMGFNVFAGCLTDEKVKELSSQCSERLCPLQMNVTDNASIQRALEIVKEKIPAGKGLWTVINNAGVGGTIAPIEWLTKRHFQGTLAVNFNGVVAVTQAFLPLVEEARGRIVHTSSVLGRAALLPPPYVLSKFCVEAYGDCLRREMAGRGVSVILVEPGGYRTDITEASHLAVGTKRVYDGLDEDVKDYYGVSYRDGLSNIMDLLYKFIWGRNPEEVVDIYIHTVMAKYPKPRYVVGWNANIVFRMMWTLPNRLVDFVWGTTLPKPVGA